MNKSAKGRAIERLAKAELERRGCLVHLAPNSSRWVEAKAGPLERIPVSIKGDIFGLFDCIAVAGPVRAFVQVTTRGEVSTKRNKIVASGFPCTRDDLILGYAVVPGGDRRLRRHFFVFRGPGFEGPGERWCVGG